MNCPSKWPARPPCFMNESFEHSCKRKWNHQEDHECSCGRIGGPNVHHFPDPVLRPKPKKDTEPYKLVKADKSDPLTDY